MKTDIHPELKEIEAVCTGCGNKFKTLSTSDNITVSICSECHPFFTGAKKIVDTEGRVDKFKKRYAKSKEKQEQHKKKKDQ